MRKLVITALLAASVSAGAIAYAQVIDPMTPATGTIPDARSVASDQEVGEARRHYRAQCERSGETHAFCDCVTAGVAQVLLPAEVRLAADGVGERMSAQGDVMAAGESDGTPPPGASSAERIAQVEGHYAGVCTQFRG